MSALYAILVLVVLVSIFIATYLLNKNTKKPDGCEELDEHCMHCSITSCRNNKNKKEE